jgi:hypothetical protein
MAVFHGMCKPLFLGLLALSLLGPTLHAQQAVPREQPAKPSATGVTFNKELGLELPFLEGSLAAEPSAPMKAETAATQKEKKSDSGEKKAPAAKTADKGARRPDPAVVSAGMAAFERSCTTCHNAARSLDRTKDLAGWRATVQRMAGKRGANIASSDIEPIAVYLASRNTASTGGESTDTEKTDDSAASKDKDKDKDTSSVSTFATLSPLWRGGGSDRLQNPGFGPLAWVGAGWQSKIVSARVTACISCHGVQEAGFISRVEVVEAAVRVDLSCYIEHCLHGWKVAIDAGRLIVPFGAFSAQANPGTYRTVSTPLIFNMGQRVFNQDLGVSVLPMPYADTAIDFNVYIPLCDLGTGPITASIDAYLLNGLQGTSTGIDFLQSRNLLDNNNRAASGGRVTVGDQYVRLGASVTDGSFSDRTDPSVPKGPLYYFIHGFDVQARYKRLFRCQIEYARRDSDRFGLPPNATAPTNFLERVDGYYLEAEVRPWEECHVSLLARHDFLRYRSPLPPPGSTLTTGDFNVERFTVGLNIELWHQSLLMFNYEHWLVPVREHTTNVFGLRYTVTF